jgi:anti-sigma B factor antagonist
MTTPALNPPELDVAVRRAGDLTLLAVSGELDIATADAFVTAVGGHLAADRPVTLDLSRLSFMDSCGVRALDAVLREADRRGRRLTIGTDLQPGVRQILELTGILAGLPLAELPAAEGSG